MELKQFVSESIVQITQGILEAREKTRETGALINPPLLIENGCSQVNRRDKMNYVPQTLHFDISVSVESTSTEGGKGKLHIAVFSASVGAKSDNRDTSTSRISFDIPVCWPSTDEKIASEDLSSASCTIFRTY